MAGSKRNIGEDHNDPPSPHPPETEAEPDKPHLKETFGVAATEAWERVTPQPQGTTGEAALMWPPS